MSIDYSKAHAVNVVKTLFAFVKYRTYLAPEVPFWINGIVNCFRSKFLGTDIYDGIRIRFALT